MFLNNDENTMLRAYEHLKTPLMIFAAIGAVAGFLSQCAAAIAEPIDGRRIVIIDGDTVALPGGERIRLQAIDTPESHRPSCEAELVAALKAKERLAELLRVPNVQVERCDIHGDRCDDGRGRTLANLRTSAGDVGQTLIREGLALPYRPGAKAERTAHWCR